jgi:DNA-binding IclR family transcriptional regulator
VAWRGGTREQEIKHMPESGGRYNIRVVDRAIRLLTMLADGRSKSLTELSLELGISSSSTFRLLTTLDSHNFVEHDRSAGGYRLGLACLELSRAYQEAAISAVALPSWRT